MSWKRIKIYSLTVLSVFFLMAALNSSSQSFSVQMEKMRIKDDPSRDFAYLIDSSLVTYSDEIMHSTERAVFLDYGFDGGEQIQHSYEITKSASYLDHWHRWYAYYLPDFTDEIPYEEGRSKIQAYYRELADETIRHVEESVLNSFINGSTVVDTAADRTQYQGGNYRVSFAGDYLSVRQNHFGYYGGAHPLYSITANCFDMRTGKLLTTEDVFATGEEADALLQSCIGKYAEQQEVYLSSYSMLVDNSLNFYFSDEGLIFIFSPYEFGPWGAGLREVAVPYEDLQSILIVDPP